LVQVVDRRSFDGLQSFLKRLDRRAGRLQSFWYRFMPGQLGVDILHSEDLVIGKGQKNLDLFY